MLYCYLGPGMLAVLERWLPYTVTILDRFYCTIMVYGLTPYIREYFTREYRMAGNFGGKIFWRIAENMSFGRIYFGG